VQIDQAWDGGVLPEIDFPGAGRHLSGPARNRGNLVADNDKRGVVNQPRAVPEVAEAKGRDGRRLPGGRQHGQSNPEGGG
jgi:hypothetical protein